MAEMIQMGAELHLFGSGLSFDGGNSVVVERTQNLFFQKLLGLNVLYGEFSNDE